MELKITIVNNFEKDIFLHLKGVNTFNNLFMHHSKIPAYHITSANYVTHKNYWAVNLYPCLEVKCSNWIFITKFFFPNWVPFNSLPIDMFSSVTLD